VKWFRGRLVFKAHRLLYHSTLGLTVIKKKSRAPLQHTWTRRLTLCVLAKTPHQARTPLARDLSTGDTGMLERSKNLSTCLALRRAQLIEREVSEAEEARAACAQGSLFLLYKRSEQSCSARLFGLTNFNSVSPASFPLQS